MRRISTLLQKPFHNGILNGDSPLIQITNATFYRDHPREPSSTAETTTSAAHSAEDKLRDFNPPLFPGLSFSLPSNKPDEVWSIVSPSSSTRATFLQILQGRHLCFPPTARVYPYFSSTGLYPARAIQYVGFDTRRGEFGSQAQQGRYLAARYESRREQTDFSLLDFLTGRTELNTDEEVAQHPSDSVVNHTMEILELEKLADMPLGQLSHGQSRRARIAKALVQQPRLLLLETPFIGLDPPTAHKISTLVGQFAKLESPGVFLSLRPEGHIPAWVSHIILADSKCNVEKAGPKDEVFEYAVQKRRNLIQSTDVSSADLTFVDSARRLYLGTDASKRNEINLQLKLDAEEQLGPQPNKHRTSFLRSSMFSRDGLLRRHQEEDGAGEVVLAIEGAKVTYGNKVVLGDWKQGDRVDAREGLWWTVRRGQRWGVFGANGSGKTTLLSLITSDHPQTYSLPIKIFGRSRLPEPGQPGVPIFELQHRIGHSSPEVHAFFPRNLSVRQTLESAWADTPLTRPRLDHVADSKIDAALRWFQGELNPELGPIPWMQKEMVMPGVDSNPSYSLYSKQVMKLKLPKTLTVIEDAEFDPTALKWAEDMKFGELSFSAQRVALFLRAILKAPDIVILDEAFSGMDDFAKDRCLLFLSHGESKVFRYQGQGGSKLRALRPKASESILSRLGRVRVPGLSQEQALIVVSHVKEEVPGCVREWLWLPQPGKGPPRTGRLRGPLELQINVWETDIWNIPIPRYSSYGRKRTKSSLSPTSSTVQKDETSN